MSQNYHALALFSGGLDSILAVKLIQEQGLNVLGLHFTSPFFGHADKIDYWERTYEIPIQEVDISESIVQLLKKWPDNGFGKILNPCVDCKILMLSRAKELLAKYGADFIISGEVQGQRPMSQRKDSLNIIRNRAEVKDILLRPLSAGHLLPTPMEKKGLVKRELLPSIWGRGRKIQMELVKKYMIDPVPTPAGGCLLAEGDAACRYWLILRKMANPDANDFFLSNLGRQLWFKDLWLTIGRNQDDNETILSYLKPEDRLFTMADYPGPLAVGRSSSSQNGKNRDWTSEELESAAAIVSSFSPRARKDGGRANISVEHNKNKFTVQAPPAKDHLFSWYSPDWKKARPGKKEMEKKIIKEKTASQKRFGLNQPAPENPA